MSEADVIALDQHRRATRGAARCGAPTAAGRPCRNRAGPSGWCRVHEPESRNEQPDEPAEPEGSPESAAGGTSRRGAEAHPARGSRTRSRSERGTATSGRAAVERFDRITPPAARRRSAAARPPWEPAPLPRPQRAADPAREPAEHPGEAGAVGATADAGDRQPQTLPPYPFGDAGSWQEAVGDALAFLRRRLTGEYAVDPLGFDPDLTEQIMLPLARPLYRDWWRVRTLGAQRVPPAGEGALVVANHAGTLPFDAIMTKLALHDEHPDHRHLRELAADLALRTPVVGHLARKSGDTLAHEHDAEWMLRNGDVVGVWPEGYKGIGKRYRDRYKLQRFGRGGFVQVALRTGAPIVPTAIVGSEEIYPMIGDVRVLARLLGTPYFPVTWTFPWLGPLGLIPLPSRWIIEFGEPIDTSGYGPEAADDAMLVFELTDRVRDTIQQMLYRNLMGRRSVFL